MALTRKFLQARNIEASVIDEIIEAHAETVNGLKDEIDKYKENAEKLPKVQKELDELKNSSADETYKKQYDELKKAKDALQAEYDNYKKDVDAKETQTKKRSAYRQLLKDVGISEKRIDSVLKVSDIDGLKLTKDGKLENEDKLKETVRAEWSDFISTEGKQGAGTPNPPAGTGGKVLSREDIYKKDDKGRYLLDATERQKALAELISNE